MKADELDMRKAKSVAVGLTAGLLGLCVRADRLVLVDPLLDRVDAENAVIRFFDDRDGTFFTRSYGKLSEGEHSITVERGGLTNRYTITARVPRKYPQGRRLNNFVTEVMSAPLQNGDVAFVNPHEGWVFVGFDRPHRDACAFLDGAAEPVVTFREGEPSETMRFLCEGEHRLRITGASGGRLTVRLVKPMKQTARSFANEVTDITTCRYNDYGWDFFRRWLIPNYNTFVMGAGWKLGSAEGRMVWGNERLKERGKRQMAASDIRPFGQDKLRANYAEIRRFICGADAYREGLALEVDEHQVNAGKDKMDAFAEGVWEMVAERKPLPMFVDYCDLPGYSLTNLIGQASSISAALNTGLGHGMLVPELYLGAMRSEASMLAQEEKALAYIESLRRLMPSAPSHVIHLMSGWLSIGGWTNYSSSEVDLKVIYAHYIHRLATDPKFHDVGGIGMSTLACNEEIARWMARLVRHYCIEGRTDSLSDRLGYSLRPEIVKNGDFMDGMTNWNASAAEDGSLEVMRRFGYGGKKGQCRMARDCNRQGEYFAAFVRGSKAPNRLSQQVTGLKPGKYYTLTYVFADLDDVEAPGSVEPDTTFSASLSCAEQVPELGLAIETPDAKARKKAKKAGTAPHCITYLRRMVFKATAEEGTLTFCDWKSGTEPGGQVGRRHLVNYIGICPYYLESEDELEELKALASRKGAK